MDEPRVWEELSRTLRSSVPYGRLKERLGEVVRLPVPAAAWVAALLAEDLRRPLLVLVPREADALAWLEGAQLLGRGDSTVYYPAPSLSPYQEAETSLLVRAQEAVALDRIVAGAAPTVVATPRALFRRLPRASDFAAAVVELAAGEEIPRDDLADHLLRFGYGRSDLVMEVGEFAVRGGIVDVFPPGEPAPLRLDFFGDTLDSVRRFEPQSQRSEERVDGARLPPLTPFAAGAEQAERLAALLPRMIAHDLGLEGAARLEELREQGRFPGWEHYLPLLAPETAALDDLLAAPLVVAVDPPALAAEAEHHAALLATDYAARREHHRLALPPEALERPLDEVMATIAAAEIRVGSLLVGSLPVGSSIGDPAQAGAPGAVGAFRSTPPTDFAATTTDLFQGQLPRFPQEVATAHDRGDRCLVVVAPGHRERMAELLGGRDIAVGRSGCELIEGELERGFRLPAAGVSIYGEQQLLPQRQAAGPPVAADPIRPVPVRAARPQGGRLRRPRRPRHRPVHRPAQDRRRWRRRRRPAAGRAPTWRRPTAAADGGDGDRLRRRQAPAPAAVAPRPGAEVQRHRRAWRRAWTASAAPPGTAPRAGSSGACATWPASCSSSTPSARWPRRRRCPPTATSNASSAPPSSTRRPPTSSRRSPPSPATSSGERPMDRLLCGDVGYGKTEVAMRAAFKVVDAGYQVAVLAPTTILADQHLETFRKRFSGFPVGIEMISRFRSAAEIREVTPAARRGEGRHPRRHPSPPLERHPDASRWGCSSSTRSSASGWRRRSASSSSRRTSTSSPCRRRRCRAPSSSRSPGCATCR